MWLIGALIQVLIIGLIFGAILQISAKVIMKEGIEFSDAFKTAVIATAVIMLGDFGLNNSSIDPAWHALVNAAFSLVVWLLALMIVIGLNLSQSFLVACVFTGLTWLIRLILIAAFSIGKSLEDAGG